LSRRTSSGILYKILVQAFFIFLSITILFSLYYLVSNSLKTGAARPVSFLKYSSPSRRPESSSSPS